MLNKPNWKTLVSALIFGLLLTITAACDYKPPEETSSKHNNANAKANAKGSDKVLNIGYQKGNTINILKESGFLEDNLKDQDIKVVWKEFNGGGALLEALFTGNIDFGHASDGSGIFSQAGNKPFTYVGADLPNPEGVGILVHEDSDIKEVKDLKGKKLAANKGGNHHYLSILALRKAGLDVEDVEWVFVSDAAQGRTAFETKKVDAFATYDPFLASAEIDLKTRNLTEGIDYGYPNRTFYYVNEDFNKNNPELTDTILESIKKSDEWANKNKPEVVKLVSNMLGIKEAVIKKATDRRDYELNRIDEEIIKVQQKQADVYHEIGLIPNKIDVSERMPIK